MLICSFIFIKSSFFHFSGRSAIKEAMAPFYTYLDQEGREHIVWFEDARSINARIALVPEYELYGASFWNIMRLFPQSWAVINSQYDIERVPLRL